MIPLGICSFLVILITLEKVFVLRKNRLASDSYFRAWELWFDSEKSSSSLPNEKTPSLLNGILFPLTDNFPFPQSRFEERLADLARKQKHKLERGVVFLDTIAGVAPLFGLLGTALGMVEVFTRLSAVNEAKMAALSSGISQALYTTVAGLCIGIPSLVAFNLITRHIDSVLITVEEQLNSLIDQFYSTMVEIEK